MVRNPFVARSMIKSERRFWGRESETQIIYSLLLDSEEEPQSIAVIGLRKIGKSSLLYRVAQKRGAQIMYRDQLNRMICVMLSMQAMSSASAAEFFAIIVDELRTRSDEMVARLATSSSQSTADPDQQLWHVLRLMDREGYLLVLLLDEFECAASNPNFQKEFFDLLRSMAQQWRLAFVVATQCDLDQLWDRSLISSPYSSPFFNFFQTLTLARFREGEGEEYVRALSRDAEITFEDLEVELACDAGGMHPFFLNVAAYHLFQALIRGGWQSRLDRDSMWAHIVQDPTVYANFRYYWQTLPLSKRQALGKVARGELDPLLAPETRVDIAWLERMGLVKKTENGTYEPFSRAFQEFLSGISQHALGADYSQPKQGMTIQDLISRSEGSVLEFKSSLRWDCKQGKVHESIEMAVIKTLAAFLNTDGGTLIIGVDDKGGVRGLDKDYASFGKKDRDGFELYLMQLVSGKLGKTICQYLHPEFHGIGGLDVCKVEVDPSSGPVYVGEEAVLYIRTGNSTQSLNTREAVAYIGQHWSHA